MSIEICLLRNGQTIIADLKEVIDKEKNTSLGYKVSNPFILEFEYLNTTKVTEDKVEEVSAGNNDIKFTPWAPLAKETDFNFPFDFIEVIYEPHKSVVDSYISILEHFTEKFKHEITVDTTQTITSSGAITDPDIQAQIEGVAE